MKPSARRSGARGEVGRREECLQTLVTTQPRPRLGRAARAVPYARHSMVTLAGSCSFGIMAPEGVAPRTRLTCGRDLHDGRDPTCNFTGSTTVGFGGQLIRITAGLLVGFDKDNGQPVGHGDLTRSQLDGERCVSAARLLAEVRVPGAGRGPSPDRHLPFPGNTVADRLIPFHGLYQEMQGQRSVSMSRLHRRVSSNTARLLTKHRVKSPNGRRWPRCLSVIAAGTRPLRNG